MTTRARQPPVRAQDDETLSPSLAEHRLAAPVTCVRCRRTLHHNWAACPRCAALTRIGLRPDGDELRIILAAGYLGRLDAAKLDHPSGLDGLHPAPMRLKTTKAGFELSVDRQPPGRQPVGRAPAARSRVLRCRTGDVRTLVLEPLPSRDLRITSTIVSDGVADGVQTTGSLGPSAGARAGEPVADTTLQGVLTSHLGHTGRAGRPAARADDPATLAVIETGASRLGAFALSGDLSDLQRGTDEGDANALTMCTLLLEDVLIAPDLTNHPGPIPGVPYPTITWECHPIRALTA